MYSSDNVFYLLKGIKALPFLSEEHYIVIYDNLSLILTCVGIISFVILYMVETIKI